MAIRLSWNITCFDLGEVRQRPGDGGCLPRQLEIEGRSGGARAQDEAHTWSIGILWARTQVYLAPFPSRIDLMRSPTTRPQLAYSENPRAASGPEDRALPVAGLLRRRVVHRLPRQLHA